MRGVSREGGREGGRGGDKKGGKGAWERWGLRGVRGVSREGGRKGGLGKMGVEGSEGCVEGGREGGREEGGGTKKEERGLGKDGVMGKLVKW